MLCFAHQGREVRIAHVTSQVGVARALKLITGEKILRTIKAVHRVLGTPVLFSSVAHGSALDIAGKGRADHGAMVEAISRLAGYVK